MFLINTALLYVLKKLAAKLKSTECYRNFSIKTVFKIITDFLKWLWNLFLFVLEPYGAFTTLITVNFAFFSSSFLIFIFYVGIFNLELNDDLRILTSLKYALYTCCSNIVIIMVCQCLSRLVNIAIFRSFRRSTYFISFLIGALIIFMISIHLRWCCVLVFLYFGIFIQNLNPIINRITIINNSS